MLPQLVHHGLAAIGRDAQESNARTFGQETLAHCRKPGILEAHDDDVRARRVDELRQVDVAAGLADELDAVFGIETPTNDFAQNARQIDYEDSLVTQWCP